MKRQHMIVAGGSLVLLLAFLWWRRQQAAAGAAAPADTAGTTSGQEQSDYSSLAGMLQQLQAQEAGDFQNVQSQLDTSKAAIDANAGSEQSDIANLDKSWLDPINALTGQLAAENHVVAAQTSEIAKLMAGQKKLQKELKKRVTHGKTGQSKKHPGSKKKDHHPDTKTGGKTGGKGGKTGAGKTSSWKANIAGAHPAVTAGHPAGAAGAHVNANHPAGTAGHAVAARSHAPSRRRVHR